MSSPYMRAASSLPIAATVLSFFSTTLAAATAAAEGIGAAMGGQGEVRSLQSYHASITTA